MVMRRTARTFVERLSWQGPGSGFDAQIDRAWVARILTYLFGFGSLLMLLTVLLPGAEGRDSQALASVAVFSLLMSAGILVAFDRLPLWFLRGAPAIGTLLVALAINFAGSEASAAYALYMAWVVIAASLFLDARLTLAHGAIAVGAYATVLGLDEAPDGLDLLRLAMTAGTVLAVALVVNGVASQIRAVLSRFDEAARTDSLTELLNRRGFDEAFQSELSRAARAGSGVGVVMLDLDGFKAFNDRNGHPAGDIALKRVARALVRTNRAVDRIARVGGEEFMVLAPDSATPGTLALAERLRRAIEIEFSGQDALTASIGVASFPSHGVEPESLIAAADGAMYEAKARGRNLVVAAPVDRSPGAVRAER